MGGHGPLPPCYTPLATSLPLMGLAMLSNNAKSESFLAGFNSTGILATFNCYCGEIIPIVRVKLSTLAIITISNLTLPLQGHVILRRTECTASMEPFGRWLTLLILICRTTEWRRVISDHVTVHELSLASRLLQRTVVTKYRWCRVTISWMHRPTHERALPSITPKALSCYL